MHESRKTSVVVFSGQPFAGKSAWLSRISQLPTFQDVPTIKMDKTRVRVFGDQLLTKTGHVYKNRATRHEIEEIIVAHRPQHLFTELVMLTKDAHQAPFVQMIKDALWYTQRMDREQYEQKGHMITESVTVELLVILFYCDLTAVDKRMLHRQQILASGKGTDGLFPVDWPGWIDGVQQFEVPTSYTPLYINTTEDSGAARDEMQEEILSFLAGGVASLNESLMKLRRAELERILEDGRNLEVQ